MDICVGGVGGYANTNDDSNTNKDCHSDVDCNAYGDGNADPDSDTNIDRNPNRDADVHAGVDGDPDGDADADCDPYADAYRYPDRDGNGDTNPYADRHTLLRLLQRRHAGRARVYEQREYDVRRGVLFLRSDPRVHVRGRDWLSVFRSGVSVDAFVLTDGDCEHLRAASV